MTIEVRASGVPITREKTLPVPKPSTLPVEVLIREYRRSLYGDQNSDDKFLKYGGIAAIYRLVRSRLQRKGYMKFVENLDAAMQQAENGFTVLEQAPKIIECQDQVGSVLQDLGRKLKEARDKIRLNMTKDFQSSLTHQIERIARFVRENYDLKKENFPSKPSKGNGLSNDGHEEHVGNAGSGSDHTVAGIAEDETSDIGTCETVDRSGNDEMSEPLPPTNDLRAVLQEWQIAGEQEQHGFVAHFLRKIIVRSCEKFLAALAVNDALKYSKRIHRDVVKALTELQDEYLSAVDVAVHVVALKPVALLDAVKGISPAPPKGLDTIVAATFAEHVVDPLIRRLSAMTTLSDWSNALLEDESKGESIVTEDDVYSTFLMQKFARSDDMPVDLYEENVLREFINRKKMREWPRLSKDADFVGEMVAAVNDRCHGGFPLRSQAFIASEIARIVELKEAPKKISWETPPPAPQKTDFVRPKTSVAAPAAAEASPPAIQPTVPSAIAAKMEVPAVALEQRLGVIAKHLPQIIGRSMMNMDVPLQVTIQELQQLTGETDIEAHRCLVCIELERQTAIGWAFDLQTAREIGDMVDEILEIISDNIYEGEAIPQRTALQQLLLSAASQMEHGEPTDKVFGQSFIERRLAAFEPAPLPAAKSALRESMHHRKEPIDARERAYIKRSLVGRCPLGFASTNVRIDMLQKQNRFRMNELRRMPLSPAQFNGIIDELLNELQNEKEEAQQNAARSETLLDSRTLSKSEKKLMQNQTLSGDQQMSTAETLLEEILLVRERATETTGATEDVRKALLVAIEQEKAAPVARQSLDELPATSTTAITDSINVQPSAASVSQEAAVAVMRDSVSDIKASDTMPTVSGSPPALVAAAETIPDGLRRWRQIWTQDLRARYDVANPKRETILALRDQVHAIGTVLHALELETESCHQKIEDAQVRILPVQALRMVQTMESAERDELLANIEHALALLDQHDTLTARIKQCEDDLPRVKEAVRSAVRDQRLAFLSLRDIRTNVLRGQPPEDILGPEAAACLSLVGAIDTADELQSLEDQIGQCEQVLEETRLVHQRVGDKQAEAEIYSVDGQRHALKNALKRMGFGGSPLPDQATANRDQIDAKKDTGSNGRFAGLTQPIVVPLASGRKLEHVRLNPLQANLLSLLGYSWNVGKILPGAKLGTHRNMNRGMTLMDIREYWQRTFSTTVPSDWEMLDAFQTLATRYKSGERQSKVPPAKQRAAPTLVLQVQVENTTVFLPTEHLFQAIADFFPEEAKAATAKMQEHKLEERQRIQRRIAAYQAVMNWACDLNPSDVSRMTPLELETKLRVIYKIHFPDPVMAEKEANALFKGFRKAYLKELEKRQSRKTPSTV